METPPCSKARRVVYSQAARMLKPPPEVCDGRGFYAWCSPSHHAPNRGRSSPEHTLGAFSSRHQSLPLQLEWLYLQI